MMARQHADLSTAFISFLSLHDFQLPTAQYTERLRTAAGSALYSRGAGTLLVQQACRDIYT
jgi:hypothetical protein